jgi:ABC-type sugar transport system substrate-binding protein
LVLGACGGGGGGGGGGAAGGETTAPADTGSSDSGTAAAPAEKFKFGQIGHDRAIEWVNYGVMNFEYACNEMGVEPVLVDAQNNMEKVLAGIEDLLSKGVDAVSVYSFSPDLDERVSDAARGAGIPIVFENAVPGDNVDRDGVVCCTYFDIGYAVAEFIGDMYPGARFYYIMGQPGMNITEAYIEGIEAAIAAGADCKMVGTAPTNWTAEEALNQTQNMLQSGVEIDVIFANNEQIAQGVFSALEDAGLKGKIPVFATGGSPLGIEMLENGDLDATMAAPTSFMGMMAAKMLATLVTGGTVEPLIKVPLTPATIDNIDEIIPWTPGPKVVEAVGGLPSLG